jgi:hypothetical protein
MNYTYINHSIKPHDTMYKVFLIVAIFTFTGLSGSYGQIIGRVGASVGNGFNNKNLGDISGGDFKIKDSNLAWKIYASTDWKFLGLEGGFRNFGEIEKSGLDGVGTSKSRGGDLFATGTIKLGFIGVFGKAGAYFGRTKNEYFDTSGQRILNEKERDTSFAWGIGAALNFGILHLRAEFENMHISSGNLAMLSIGAGFNLNKNKKK